MPKPGEILWYQDYEFQDGNGSKKDKYFVVLNSADTNYPCLVLKTTSQSKRYTGSTKGCNRDKKVFFIPSGWEDCFKVDTYVQLPQIIEIPTKELLKGSLCKRIRCVNSLSAHCLEQLKQCLSHFRHDISAHHWEMIY